MVKRAIICASILVVILFLVQPIASIFVGHAGSDQKETYAFEEKETFDLDTEESPLEHGSRSAGFVGHEKSDTKYYLEKLEENRRRMMEADPKVPIPEYNLDEMIFRDDGSVSDYERNFFETSQAKEIRFGLPETNEQITGTRAPGADLDLTQMEWESKINTGWASATETTSSPGNQPAYGGFMVGVSTRITVTVVNLNPAIPVLNQHINFSIWEYYSGQPLIKSPTQVEFSITGQNQNVYLDFVPPISCTMYISAYIDYPADTDKSNNGIGWYGMRVLIWSSDFESSGGYGDGSQNPNTWSGDTGTTDNTWYKTSTAEQQNSPDHTTTISHHHGIDNGVPTDDYDDSYNLYLESPQIDMGDISDGQEELGYLKDGWYYGLATPYWGGLYTGSAESGDVLYAYEYSDDGGNNWRSQYDPVEGTGIISGNWGTQDGTASPSWYPDNFMFARMISDGQGGNRPSKGAKNWTQVQFRINFAGDNDGLTTNLPGYYADDFITWGYQHYKTPYDVHLLRTTHFTQNNNKGSDIPLLFPNSGPAEFQTVIHTHGESLSNVPVTVDIKKGTSDKDAPSVPGWPKTQTVASATEDDESTSTFSWTPTEAGDYYILIEAGELSKDYITTNNNGELKVYVRDPGARVLVVDDDNSRHNGGIFYKDVEGKMLDALDDLKITYNVFNVVRNGTGPTKEIMDDYEAVIWLTGLDNEYSNYYGNPDYGKDWGITIKTEDQNELMSYLNQGKKNLWLISPCVVYDLTDSNDQAGATGFLKDYLHVASCNANESTPDKLSAEKGSLAEGIDYLTSANDVPAGFSDRGSIIQTDSVSSPLFFQNPAKTSYNSLQYSENYNLVYFAFNFYLINDPSDRMDLTYRVLNFFGLVGGIKVERDDIEIKNIDFGRTASFKFKVTNLAMMTDTVNIKLETPSNDNLPDGWTITLNGKKADATINELDVPGNNGEKIFYINVSAPAQYLDNDGNLDIDIENTTAFSEIQFKVRVESKKYPDKFFGLASCRVILGMTGYIELTDITTIGSIDFSQNFFEENNYFEHKIELQNVTNGMDDYSVKLSLDNPTDLSAVVLVYGKDVTDDITVLPPRQEVPVTVKVEADEHTLAGDYSITLNVMDKSGLEVLNSTTVTTTIKQYHNIAISPVVDEVYSVILDPNRMTGSTERLSFEVTLENYGNGPDIIGLEWDENDRSPDGVPYEWFDSLIKIYDKDNMIDTLEDIEVPAYDPVTDEPGTASIIVEVKIPKEEWEGRFWVDLIATSTTTVKYINNLVRDDFAFEANFTFQVEMLLPELKFDMDECKLIKTDGTEYIPGIDKLYVNNKLSIKAAVMNSGNSKAEDITVKFSSFLDGVPIADPESRPVDIDVDGTVDLNFTIIFTESGTYSFEVRIDPNDEVIGDINVDNSWTQYMEVKDPPDNDKNGPGEPLLSSQSSAKLAILGLIIVVIVIIIVVVLLMFFRKKKRDDDEFSDLDEAEALGLPLKGARMPMDMPASTSIRTAPAPAGELKALAPAAQKQLPAAEKTGGIQTCGSCGEKNLPENKFCQGCGGRL